MSAAETNTKFPVWYHSSWSPGDQPSTWWQIDYTELLSLEKRQHFVLTGINTYFGHVSCMCFPCTQCFIIAVIQESTECLIHGHDIPHTLLVIKKSLCNKLVWHWAHVHEIHWSYHVSHHLEAIGIIEQWSILLKS